MCPENSTLIDLFITNSPHKHSSVSVFSHDVSDYCVIAAIKDTRIPKINLAEVHKALSKLDPTKQNQKTAGPDNIAVCTAVYFIAESLTYIYNPTLTSPGKWLTYLPS